MPVYYFSYADERGGKPWRRIVGVLAAMLIIGVVAAGAWLWVTGDDGSSISAPVHDTPEAVPFAAAIPTVYQENTDTLFLVDISGSIAESGNLEPMRTALASIALGDARPDIHTATENSQAALITFGVETKTAILLESLQGEAERNQWVATVGSLETSDVDGTHIYDAVAAALDMLPTLGDSGRSPVIVLLSDGIDGSVGECRPATAEDTRSTLYCVGTGGDPVLCDDSTGGRGSGGMREICDAIPSATAPGLLLRRLAASAEQDGLTVHTIGYGPPVAHTWLKRAADATGGKYIYAER